MNKGKMKRKGMTVVETVVALMLMALAVVVMGRLTTTRLVESESLNYQYTMQAADGLLYGMYKDFHACRDFTIEDLPHQITVAFDLGADGTHVYTYVQDEYMFYLNGASQFKCEAFTASGSMQHLYLSLKLANGERLEYDIFR